MADYYGAMPAEGAEGQAATAQPSAPQAAYAAPVTGTATAPPAAAVGAAQPTYPVAQYVAAQPQQGYPAGQAQYGGYPAQPAQGYYVASGNQGLMADQGGQQRVLIVAQQPASYNGNGQPSGAKYMDDDPALLYVGACFGLFFPLVGLICMCAHNCGRDLPPRKAAAYRVMVLCTLLGLIIAIVVSVA